jgi:uncharacterized protein YjdB
MMTKLFIVFSLALIPAAASGQTDFATMATPKIAGVVHVENKGDLPLVAGEWAGTKGQSLRLEAIRVAIVGVGDVLRIEYLCHLENIGDVGHVAQNARCGTEGQSRRMEAIRFRLNGPAAPFFTVRYQCHVQNRGDLGPFADDVTCGARPGESLRLEAVRVWLERASKK